VPPNRLGDAAEPLLIGKAAKPLVVGSAAEPLVVGIVNNMPDTALRATERHFSELLDAASCGQPIRLRLFHAPQVPRGEACHAYLSLWRTSLIGPHWRG